MKQVIVLNGQGGRTMSITIEKTATLRAQDHGPPPLIIFEPRSQDGVPRIVKNDVSPTLNTMRGGQRQPCVVIWKDDSIQSD